MRCTQSFVCFVAVSAVSLVFVLKKKALAFCYVMRLLSVRECCARGPTVIGRLWIAVPVARGAGGETHRCDRPPSGDDYALMWLATGLLGRFGAIAGNNKKTHKQNNHIV